MSVYQIPGCPEQSLPAAQPDFSIQAQAISLSASNAWFTVRVKQTATSSVVIFQGHELEVEPFHYSLSSGSLDFWYESEENVYDV